MANLDKYPFLNAALDDIALASDLAHYSPGKPRHVVMLLHDALEFILYETLQMMSEDIYKSGQNTIGLDSAIALCKEKNIELPLLGTIRTIQKHRGDAKHHAQTPHEKAFSKMVAEFRIIASRLIHEQFAEALGQDVEQLGLLPYHTALYDSYRKYRTHNWSEALRFSLSALLHKHRSLLNSPDDYSGGRRKPIDLVGLLKAEIDPADYPPAPAGVIEELKKLPGELEQLLEKNEITKAAETAGIAYAKIDGVLPSIFDITKARKLTERLVQPSGFSFGRSMGWSQWQGSDTERRRDVGKELQESLSKNPKLVKSFGHMHYMEDDDRYWKWWEFAVFDGTRWQSFHLSDRFELSLEIGNLKEDEGKGREEIAEIILEQFRLASQEA